MMERRVEPLALCSTFRKHAGGPLSLVSTERILGKQLAEYSSPRFDRSDLGGDPITLRKQGLVQCEVPPLHWRQARPDCGDIWAGVARSLTASRDMSPNAAGRTLHRSPDFGSTHEREQRSEGCEVHKDKH